jgi:hypothetical protein
MISPSDFSIDEYILITPLEIELIKNIEVIEKIKLKYIKVVFSLLAFNAFKADAIKVIPYCIFTNITSEYEKVVNKI